MVTYIIGLVEIAVLSVFFQKKFRIVRKIFSEKIYTFLNMQKTTKISKNRAQSSKTGNSLVRKYSLILGIPVDSTSASSVLTQVEDKIVKKQRFFIVTPNPEIIVRAQSDPILSRALSLGDLCLPDGIGLVWASKFLAGRSGWGVPERVSGIDIVELLVKSAAQNGWRVFLLGGMPGVAAAAAQRLSLNFQSRRDKLRLFSIFNFQWDSGPFLDKDGIPINKEEEGKEKGVIEKINKFKPDILFVAFGAPKQEKWVTTNYNRIQSLVTMVVGGSFDYISGNVPRAPRWMRKIGLEWLFRLITEPWRIGRQLSLIKFVWLVIKVGFSQNTQRS